MKHTPTSSSAHLGADSSTQAAGSPSQLQENNDPLQLPQAKGLSPQQHLALAAIASGRNQAQAAAAAGVFRTTLYRWQKSDPAFVAALNAWRDHTLQGARDRLLGAVDQAVATVIAHLEKKDVRTAMGLLKQVGALAAVKAGPVLPLGAAKTMELARIKESADLFCAAAEADKAADLLSFKPWGRRTWDSGPALERFPEDEPPANDPAKNTITAGPERAPAPASALPGQAPGDSVEAGAQADGAENEG